MKVIGITGGVGTGKSIVTKILEEHYGAHTIGTDQVAHTLMEKGQISYNLIRQYFGDEILDHDGNIDRGKLGFIVYRDENERLKLNSFTHPYVMEEVKNIIETKRKENYKYVCVETALPVEAGLKDFCDKIWFIYSSDEIRAKRLKESRNYSDEKIKDIMSKQLSKEEYEKYSTDVIINENSRSQIISQIDDILERNSHGNM